MMNWLKEQIKDPEMIESINKNREADKDIERNRSKLDVLDNAGANRTPASRNSNSRLGDG